MKIDNSDEPKNNIDPNEEAKYLENSDEREQAISNLAQNLEEEKKSDSID